MRLLQVIIKGQNNFYLDYWCDPTSDFRIEVCAWVLCNSIETQYVTRNKNARMIWHYVRRIGVQAVIRKIRSRLAEINRNEKYTAIGLGKVLESPIGATIEKGQCVLFFASNHPRCVNCLTINRHFVLESPELGDWTVSEEKIVFIDGRGIIDLPKPLIEYIAWSPFCGIDPDEKNIRVALRSIKPLIGDLLARESAKKEGYTITSGPPCERIEQTKKNIKKALPSDQLSGVIFGLGNYAKTQILPNLHGKLRITCIHEIDPLQLGPVNRWSQTLDTSPWPREDENYDVWFASGYHHTHTRIAVHALLRGSYAVVEKPISTTWLDFKKLHATLDSLGSSHFFACFHKRYSPFNGIAIKDLNIRPGEPINYYCIVYEIPLPRQHWYNWMSSRSRITSNGCHWLDHFMHLNGYASILDATVKRAGNGDLTVLLQLENGASFSMTLTDIGSERLGVRDYIELRAGRVTIRIIDSCDYFSENTGKIIRRKRINPMSVYAKMYKDISNAIVNGMLGDPLASLRSTEVMLRLEDELNNDMRAPEDSVIRL